MKGAPDAIAIDEEPFSVLHYFFISSPIKGGINVIILSLHSPGNQFRYKFWCHHHRRLLHRIPVTLPAACSFSPLKQCSFADNKKITLSHPVGQRNLFIIGYDIQPRPVFVIFILADPPYKYLILICNCSSILSRYAHGSPFMDFTAFCNGMNLSVQSTNSVFLYCLQNIL